MRLKNRFRAESRSAAKPRPEPLSWGLTPEFSCTFLTLAFNPKLHPRVINHTAKSFPNEKELWERDIFFGPVLTAQSLL
jgi:hypothetical protein